MLSPTKLLKSVVLVGKFNPSIFQPAWFSHQKLIGENDSLDAEVNIIHADVVNFRLNWCNLEVTRERMVIHTTKENAFEQIRDLAIGTFRLLPHTPMNMLGINTEMHLSMKSADEWHSFGHQLAPKKQFWDGILKNPGTAAVSIQGERPDSYIGKIAVDVQPSAKSQYGVSFRVNDHYEIKEKENFVGCEEIINILESEWETSQLRATEIIEHVMQKIIR